MRMKELGLGTSVVNAPCLTMEATKDITGGGVSLPITNTGGTNHIKYSPNRNNDIVVNSSGILSPPNTPSATTPVDNECSPSNSSGRFKFFKDGKFILELWHHKNGERMYWIPVSKNSTCWPPTGSASRQESSASLSVSDDNLSVQSSPWQRDHAWKQNSPCKNASKGFEFLMQAVHLRSRNCNHSNIKRHCRRPYDLIKLENAAQKTSSNKKNSRSRRKQGNLVELIPLLWDRRRLSESRSDPGIVSPRKRILKELEKVSLDELGNVNKKHRTKTGGNSPSSTTISATATITSSKPVSSHSINSILAKDEEPSVLRNLLKSPSSENSHDSSQDSSTDVNSPTSATTLPSPSHTGNTHYSTYVPASLPMSACTAHYMYHYPAHYMANHTPYFAAAIPGNYHHPLPAPTWGFHSLSSLHRPSVYPYLPLDSPHLIPLAHPSLHSCSPPIMDNGTDVPLNLSKHPG